MRIPVKKLVLSGLLVALGLLLKIITNFNLITAGALTLTISLGIVPAIFGGIALGPFYGAAIGLLYDLLDTLLIPPIFAIDPRYLFSAAMLGFTPGALIWLGRRLWHWKEENYWVLCLTMLLSQLLFSTLLNTYFNATYTAAGGEALRAAFLAQLATRWTALLQVPIYALLCKWTLRVYRRQELQGKPATPSNPTAPPKA